MEIYSLDSSINHFAPEIADLERKLGNSLSSVANLALYQKGEKLVTFDQGTEQLFFLLAGKAKIYLIHEDGKQSLVQFIQAGELIGELSLLEIEERTKDVVAQRSCTCLVLPLTTAKELLLTNPVFLLGLNRYLGQKLLERTERFSEGLNYPLINRLAAFILFAETADFYQEKHTEVAEYLNVSYRHLLYTFQQLRDLGAICKEKQGYRLLERKLLKNFAKDIHS